MSLSKVIKNELNKDDMLLTPRYEQFVATHPELIIPEEITKWMMGQLEATPRLRWGSWSASSLGKCRRKHVFVHERVKPRKQLDSDKHLIFFDGHFRHIKWQGIMLWAGLLDEAETPAYIDEFNARCTIDGISTHPDRGRHGVEFKGANDRSYKWVLQSGPMEDHLRQIHAYMWATGLDLWSLIYENKNTQEWKEFVIEKDDELMESVREELNDLTTAIAYDALPEPLDKCIDHKGPYRRCEFRHICLDATKPSLLPKITTQKIIRVQRSK